MNWIELARVLLETHILTVAFGAGVIVFVIAVVGQLGTVVLTGLRAAVLAIFGVVLMCFSTTFFVLGTTNGAGIPPTGPIAEVTREVSLTPLPPGSSATLEPVVETEPISPTVTSSSLPAPPAPSSPSPVAPSPLPTRDCTTVVSASRALVVNDSGARCWLKLEDGGPTEIVFNELAQVTYRTFSGGDTIYFYVAEQGDRLSDVLGATIRPMEAVVSMYGSLEALRDFEIMYHTPGNGGWSACLRDANNDYAPLTSPCN